MRQLILSLSIGLAALHCSAICAVAQSAEPFNYYANITPSAESYEMVRYGEMNHSLYTGEMTYSLPLYTYHDEDFTLPISLEYHYSGFKPAQTSGIIGYGWTLNCGGAITREVRGFPDEYCGMDECDDQQGYFYYLSATIQNEGIVNSKITCPSTPTYDFGSLPPVNIISDTPTYADILSLTNEGGMKYDCSPDIFHFSFLGYSGSFMMNNDGRFLVFDTNVPPGEISVTTDFVASPYAWINFFSFTIKTGNGYEYSFGGSKASCEYDLIYSNGEGSPTLSAWRLRSIKAPNEKELVLLYDSNHDIQERITPTIHPSFSSYAVSYDTEWQNICGGSHPAQRTHSISRSYSCRLSRIEKDNRQILFDYTEKEENEEFSSNWTNDRYNARATAIGFRIENDENHDIHKRLSHIAVTNGTETVEQFFLNHIYKGNSLSHKMFLSTVTSTKSGKHSFDYNEPVLLSFPLNDTSATDHWGYSRATGSDSFHGVFDLTNGSLYDQMLTNSKEPDLDFTNRYGLTKITYPTGGRTEIEYEPNDVSSVLDREYGQFPVLIDTSSITPGGVRVRKIKNISMEYRDSVTFDYVSHYGESTQKSSGILLYMPRYTVSLYYGYHYHSREPIFQQPTHIEAECELTGYTLEGSFENSRNTMIGYSDVVAIYSDGSRTDYSFYDYHDYPDVFYGNNGTVNWLTKTYAGTRDYVMPFSSSDVINTARMILPPSECRNNIRGRLKKKTEHSGNRILETEYTYRIDTLASIQMVHNAMLSFVIQDHICNQISLISESSREIEGERHMGLTTQYEYNQAGQIKKKTTMGPGGNGDAVYYRYWHETDTTYLPSQVRDLVKTKRFGSEKYLTESVAMDYNNKRNPSPSLILSYIIDKPINITQVNDVFSIGRNNGAREISLLFNNLLRPVTVVYPGNSWIEYTWDTDGNYILSKEENDTDNIHLYEWKDLVGLTKVTWPTRASSFYFYDEKSRLAVERDTKGEVLYHYFYHLNNE